MTSQADGSSASVPSHKHLSKSSLLRERFSEGRSSWRLRKEFQKFAPNMEFTLDLHSKRLSSHLSSQKPSTFTLFYHLPLKKRKVSKTNTIYEILTNFSHNRARLLLSKTDQTEQGEVGIQMKQNAILTVDHPKSKKSRN